MRRLNGASGEYEMHGELARGGMAVVHIGRAVRGPAAGKLVAVKQLDSKLASKAAFIAMFLDEARLAMRIRHRNVAATLDVLESGGELFQVLEYIPGESLARIACCAKLQCKRIPLGVVSAIICDALRGLDCAHHTRRGDEALGVVHRDISPQNIIVGADGVARILDFGVAKSAHRVHWTPYGSVSGKVAYIAPEQLRCVAVTARADLYSLGVVLWELLTGDKLRSGRSATAVLHEALRAVPPPSSRAPTLDPDVDAVLARACAIDPLERYASAARMETTLAAALSPATPEEVAEFVKDVSGPALAARQRLVRDSGLEERENGVVATLPPPPPAAAQVVRESSHRAATRRFSPQSELDDAYLTRAGFAPESPRLSALRAEPFDVRRSTWATPPPLRSGAPRSHRSRRPLGRDRVRADASQPAEMSPSTPRPTRDELAAASFGSMAESLDGLAVTRPLRLRGPPTPVPPSQEPLEAPVVSRLRRSVSTVACGLVLTAAVLVLAFGGPRASAHAPRPAYAWISAFMRVRVWPAAAVADGQLNEAAAKPGTAAPH
ncbi:MAG: protein kinase [Polyangiaceae bacterium]